jgi:hypothetical protein
MGDDPLDSPEYLRGQSRRLGAILRDLSDPDVKRELAAYSFQLAQRAKSLARLAEDPAVIRINIERYRAMIAADLDGGDRATVKRILDEAEQALAGHRTLRQLACWYREFAERAGSQVVRETRLRLAEDLDK